MQRLSGLDATFLALDAGNACGHGGGVAVLDPAGPQVTAADLVALFAARMPPVLRRRLATVPLGLDLPYWVDAEPVLAEHVHEVAVGPGGIPAAVADLHARRLERTRPLWAAYLLHSPGGQAVYLKVHHALVDGVGGNALLTALFGPGQAAEERAIGAHSTPELLARSVASLPGRVARALGTGARAARALPSVRHQVLRRAPASVLGGTLSPDRQLALVSLPLAQVRRVRTTLGLSVNDVAVTLTTGALRNWLGVADELPPEPLVAAVPMSLRVPGGGEGNQFVLMSTELATFVADPVERARATAGALDAAKRAYAALPPTVMADLTAVAAPALAGAAVALAGRVGLLDHLRPFNVMISTVPGPAGALAVAGTPVLAYHPISQVADGQRLNVTMLSYADALHIGLLADAALPLDVDRLGVLLVDELARLVLAAT